MKNIIEELDKLNHLISQVEFIFKFITEKVEPYLTKLKVKRLRMLKNE